jgi:myo-inositol-1(or 4)-monophosphatase
VRFAFSGAENRAEFARVTTYTPLQLVHVARGVARDAATLLSSGYRQRPAASEKGSRSDLVTEYDTRSEALIRSRLERETPGVTIVAEEQGGLASGLTWHCDPLDGTTNFVHGHPFFCVSIGAADESGPIAGAVVAPALGVEWWGGRGLGAFRNGGECRVSDTDSLENAMLGTGFPPVGRQDPLENNIATFGRMKLIAQSIRRCGSAAIDCCLVADGTYDAYWERALHSWDLMGGCAIALAAGAKLTSLTGGEPDLFGGRVVLSNGKIHDQVVAIVGV